MTDYLARLNPEQREAVETVDGPLLVLAGAGTGKTRVLTTRFAHILLTGRAYPARCWRSPSPTRRRARCANGSAPSSGGRSRGCGSARSMRCARACCAAMPSCVGLTANFTILDTDDQLRLLKQVMEASASTPSAGRRRRMMAVIQRWKDRGLTPARVTPAEDTDFADGRARELYAAYQARLAALNAADFGDLLLHMTEILRAQPDVLAQYHRTFRYILVDEYQDTNLVQYLWLRLLAQGHRNICCVGDDDQSIYSWRGAEVENILRFEKDFPGAKIVRLEANYRSTAPILAAASALIAHNEGRLGKTLRPGRQDANGGEKVSVVGLWDSDEEARMVGERIEALRRDGHPLAEMAMLVRAGFQTRAFEERLITLGHALPRGRRPALLRASGDPRRHRLYAGAGAAGGRSGVRAHRQRAAPRRRRGGAARDARGRAWRWRAAVRGGRAIGCRRWPAGAGCKEAVTGLLRGFARWREMLERDGHVVTRRNDARRERLHRDVAAGQIAGSAGAAGELEGTGARAGGLRDAGRFPRSRLAGDGERGERGRRPGVSLMTLHGAKGLEFDTVFLPGWEEGLFPNQRALDECGVKGLEEERRLAYVGLTRARRRAIVSHAANRRIYANWQTSIPSRFIDELPEPRSSAPDRRRWRAMRARWRPRCSPASSRWWRAGARVTEVWEQPARPARANAIPVGARVFHQKFGYGTVTAADDDRLDVAFDKAGEKRVLDRFVEPV